MKPRRLAFWIVLLAFAGFVLWRITAFRYEPEKLFRAIPTAAVLVSEHDDLAGNIDAVLANPLIAALLESQEVDMAELAAAQRNPVVRGLLDRFASRKSVIGYVPSLGAEGEPAWVLASWAGHHGQFVRWGFYPALLEDLEPQLIGRGRTGWVLRNAAGDDSNRHLSLAVTDGILLGCLSADVSTVGLLLRRVEAGVPLAPGLRRAAARAAEPAATPVMARGVVGHVGLYGQEADSPLWTYDLAFDEQGGLSGRVDGPRFMSNAVQPIDMAASRLDVLSELLGNAPGAIVAAPFETLRGWVDTIPSAEGVALVLRELADNVPDGAPAFVGICRPDFSGRILGLRVPTLLVGVPMARERHTEPAVGRALDQLNARYGLALIRRLQPEGDLPLIAVENASRGLLSELGQVERPTYILRDGWLIVSSNRDGLIETLRQPRAERRPPTWTAAGAGNVQAFAWFDLDAVAEALSKFTAIYDLAAYARGKRREEAEFREYLELANTWLAAVLELDQLSLQARQQDGRTLLTFAIGE